MASIAAFSTFEDVNWVYLLMEGRPGGKGTGEPLTNFFGWNAVIVLYLNVLKKKKIIMRSCSPEYWERIRKHKERGKQTSLSKRAMGTGTTKLSDLPVDDCACVSYGID